MNNNYYVRVLNEEEFKNAQLKLFELGCKWRSQRYDNKPSLIGCSKTEFSIHIHFSTIAKLLSYHSFVCNENDDESYGAVRYTFKIPQLEIE